MTSIYVPGANVVSILSEKENQFIADQLKKSVQSDSIWLGMIFDTDSKYQLICYNRFQKHVFIHLYFVKILFCPVNVLIMNY